MRVPAARPDPGRRAQARLVWFSFLAIVLLVKVIVLSQLAAHPLLQPAGELDSGYYATLARQVASGDLTAGHRVFFISPLYIYFLAAILVVSGGGLIAAQVVQIVLGTAAVGLVWLTARDWFGLRAAWVAGALAALTGQFTFNEVLVLQSALDPFLTALALFLLARAWRLASPAALVTAGIALGLLVLNRPNALLFAVAAIGITAIARLGTTGAADGVKGRGHAKDFAPGRVAGRPGLQRARRSGQIGITARGWAAASFFAAGLALALAPVAIRNLIVSGEWALVASHGGLNFLIGNGPGATGTYRTLPAITPSIAGQEQDARRVAEAAEGRSLSDSEVSAHFYRQAWSWIRDHPGTAVALFARKIAYVFNAADISLNYSYAYYSRDEQTLLRFLFVGPWLLLPLGLFGAIAARPWSDAFVGGDEARRSGARAGAAAWCGWLSFVPIYAVSVALFFVSGRYRLPLLVPLCVTATGGLDPVWRLWRSGRLASMALAASLLAALAVATNWSFGLDDGRAQERTEMILRLVDGRDDVRASALMAGTERLHPEPALLLFRVGQAYLARGDAARAVPLLERAIAIEPSRHEVSLRLGQALLDVGRANEAIPHLRTALAAGVQPDQAAFDLARALAATGARQDSLAALRQIRGGESLDASSQYAVGRLALQLGDARLAEWYLQRAMNGRPGDVPLREALALAQSQQGRRREALATLEGAARLDPQSASVRVNLAVLHAEEGRYDEARRWAEEALRIQPDYERARAFLDALPPR
jgi:tetratricopeptide (TPR) repeat protein